jgi:hypothetical protein
MAPLIILAGAVLDMGVQFAERRRFAWWKGVLFLAAAAMAGNLICFVKRLIDPMGAFFSAGNIDDLLFAGGLHAIFGLVAGLIGALAGYALLKFRASRRD